MACVRASAQRLLVRMYSNLTKYRSAAPHPPRSPPERVIIVVIGSAQCGSVRCRPAVASTVILAILTTPAARPGARPPAGRHARRTPRRHGPLARNAIMIEAEAPSAPRRRSPSGLGAGWQAAACLLASASPPAAPPALQCSERGASSAALVWRPA